MNNTKMSNTRDMNDEVEELLRAAEDAALLKLILNSHTVSASSSGIHPDLDQRFRDLLKPGVKSKAKPEALTKKIAPVESTKVKVGMEEDDDLFARFAALKASVPEPPSTLASLVGKDIAEDDEEDEVEKVMRWAMDAARLDPSPTSDDEDDENEEIKDDYSDDSENSDEDADSPKRNQKGPSK